MRRLYVPAFDIWTVPGYLRGLIQPGQWVTAGPNGPVADTWARNPAVLTWWPGRTTPVAARATEPPCGPTPAPDVALVTRPPERAGALVQ